MRHCRRFLAGIPHWKAGHPCDTHPSATPFFAEAKKDVRLACVRHAASVYPEPGSNSPSNFLCRISSVWRLKLNCMMSVLDKTAWTSLSLFTNLLPSPARNWLGYNELTGSICYYWFLTTLQLFKYMLDAFAPDALFQFPARRK